MWNKTLLEQPRVPVSGDSRYLTHLWVSANTDEPGQSDASQSVTICSELQADSLYHLVIEFKIRGALKQLVFREQHVLVQFWSPHDVGIHQVLTTIDQPFGVGVASEQLCFYRKDFEHKAFIVDKDHQEKEDISPHARVFMSGIPEWTTDLNSYSTKDFPQLDCAIHCNLHGYLALPVSDPTTGLCVGVVELLTSSKLEDFAYEVKHIHQELQIWNLASPKPFDGPASILFKEGIKMELDKIFGIMKFVCDTHNLPLAQTWTVSPSATCFAHEKSLQKGCSSFNTRCFGKDCMSTALPYYVQDLSVWSFMEASKECHLEKSRGVAGRALSSRGSCFCGDVTRLDEEEYPLVHNARMSGLTGCFAIFLHSVECDDDYVLEFFLPLEIKDSHHVLNLIQTIKQSVEDASGFELGDDLSYIESVVRPSMDLSVNETDSSDDSESIVMDDTSETDYANVADQCPLTNDGMEEISDNFIVTALVNVTFKESMAHFAFPLSQGLSKLENEIAKRFKLESQKFRLKYMDREDDLILICNDDDLGSALEASGGVNLLCFEG